MNRKIKLLHVTSSLKIGGAESVLCDIIRKLGNDDFEHHVIYFHAGPNVDRVIENGAKVYHVCGLAWLYDPIFFARLFFLVKRLRPDIIHSLLWSANVSSRLVSWFLKIPNVSAYHLDVYNDGIFRKMIDRVTKRISDSIVAVSQEIAQSLSNNKLCCKIEVIRNGIDFYEIHKDLLKNNIKREDLGLTSENFIIGSVGRLHPQKNFPLLLKSFALINMVRKNARLVIVGVGQLENYLKELANQLGIRDNVTFVIGKKACDYYPVFDCFVQSSIKEGVSIALLEAMSFELPCIVTNKGEKHPVVENKKNGIIVESGNEQMLYNAILSVMDNKHLANMISRRAKQHVLKNFSAANMTERYRSIFLSLSNRKSKRRERN